MSDMKLKFEFDWEEVFEGIKQGVIREIEEEDFRDYSESAVRQIKNEILSNIRVTYGEDKALKEEVKREAKDEVFKLLINEVGDKYIDSFDSYMKTQLSKNPERLRAIEDKIIYSLEEKLYVNIYEDLIKRLEAKLVSRVLNSFKGITESQTTQTISNEEIEWLREREKILSRLENYGVDNWSGYNLAMQDEE